jgi:hypothetical protein
MILKKQLGYSQQEALLEKFFFLLGPQEQYSDFLCENGLMSFRAWADFERKCCSSEAELAALSLYVLQRAQAYFSRPDGFLGREISSQLDAVRPWGDRFDGENKLELSRLLILQDERKEKLSQYREAEYDLWTKSNFIAHRAHGKYVKYFSDVMLSTFSGHGFRFDIKKSRDNFPVFSKPIVDGWDICWSAESNRTLDWWPRDPSPNVSKWSELDLRCYVCSDKKIGNVVTPIRFTSTPFVILKLDRLVDAFGWAYSRFNGPEQMEFCVFAYSRLYAAFESKIEKEFAELLVAALEKDS